LANLTGLEFFGKVPQKQLAKHLQTAGLLVFPSQSFETAGLAIVDAQASGCPVLATGVGGVPEYLKDGELGQILYDLNPNVLRESIANLLRNRDRLIGMSRAAEKRGRERPWSVVAGEVMHWAENAARERMVTAQRLAKVEPAVLPEVLEPICRTEVFAASDVLQAHDRLIGRDEFSDADLERALIEHPGSAWPHLVIGIRHEGRGAIEEAISAYRIAAELSDLNDWQAFFRLALIHAERRELPLAGDFAKRVLERAPAFPYRHDLQQLINLANG
jgi:tetratricopeptide (TPR) repeat protein